MSITIRYLVTGKKMHCRVRIHNPRTRESSPSSKSVNSAENLYRLGGHQFFCPEPASWQRVPLVYLKQVFFRYTYPTCYQIFPLPRQNERKVHVT
jgi:hypothetical protein